MGLNDLQIGETARICHATGRLREMGLLGEEVEMIRPGTTCIIRVGGQRLAIRSETLELENG